jgi:hypothetical protein
MGTVFPKGSPERERYHDEGNDNPGDDPAVEAASLAFFSRRRFLCHDKQFIQYYEEKDQRFLMPGAVREAQPAEQTVFWLDLVRYGFYTAYHAPENDRRRGG